VLDIAVLGGDLCSVLGVSGVPAVVILHPSGNCHIYILCLAVLSHRSCQWQVTFS